MSSLVFVNVAAWAPEQVCDWMKGLDDVVAQYIPHVLEQNITGKKLLCLSHADLEKCHMTKLGHQEIVMEAVDHLTQMHFELDSQTLQSLAVRLSCRANSLHNEVKSMYNEMQSVICGNIGATNHRLPPSLLAYVFETVSSAVQLVVWLDKSPFEGAREYIRTRNEVVSNALSIVKAVAPREDLVTGQEVIMKTCKKITGICKKLIRESTDSLILQPASLEIATIRKKPEEELGLRINSTYSGTHINLIKDQSPSDVCGKVEEGDEIVQVNYQTVVGWSHDKLVHALKENQKEVTLTLKKRPRHANPLGGQGQRNRKKNMQQSTFPKALSRRSRESEKGARAPLKDFLSAFPHQSPPESLSESCHEINIDVSGLIVHGVGAEEDADEEVFQGHTDTLLEYPLDPKQRRATVSGGSPTLTRPSIIVDDFELSPVRPKSHTISSPSSEDTYSTGTSTSEGQASPELDMRNKTEGLESSDSETLKLSPSTERRIELKLREARTPLTASKSCEPAGSGGRGSPGRRGDSPAGRARGEPAGGGGGGVPRKGRSGEVASDTAKGSPSLVRIRRLDSKTRADLEQKDRQKQSPENVRPQSMVSSYTVNVVGGVVHRLPSNSGSKEVQDAGSQSQSILRPSRKTVMKKLGTHRRISCKDLGHGDCQGWLWKKKESGGVLSHKWSKRWFVMKRQNLYYYKTPEDSHAEGVLYLPGFKISPAPEIKSKKYAFKTHHSGTTFFFAAERQDDMGKWMNKLGLAAITYDSSGMRTAAGVYRPDSPPHQVLLNNAGYYSESDEDKDSSSSTPSSPATPRSTTPVKRTSISPLRISPSPPDISEGDQLAQVYSTIRGADLALDGSSVRQKRTSTMAPADRLHIRNSQQIHITRKLFSLQRTLRAKEKELEALEAILQNPASLRTLQTDRPDILEHLYGEHIASSTQSDDEEFSC